jgi:hypothetical protein
LRSSDKGSEAASIDCSPWVVMHKKMMRQTMNSRESSFIDFD